MAILSLNLGHVGAMDVEIKYNRAWPPWAPAFYVLWSDFIFEGGVVPFL